MDIRRYIIPRLIQFFIVIFIGITITFIVPRITPIDPVEAVINRIMQYGVYMDASSIEQMRATLVDLYGLSGSVIEQYGRYLLRLVSGDLGPSLSMFPTPVTEIIYNALPWTLGLLLTSMMISWVIGNILGGVSGYFSEKKWSKAISMVATTVYPIPYYIMGLIMIILFVYLIPLFPMIGGFSIGLTPSFSLGFIASLLKHAFLPALSLITIGCGWWFLSMKALSSTTKSEDFVQYAEASGIPRHKILFGYVIKNSMLPQVTQLALQIGGVFNGALVTEYLFSYPGLGQVLYIAITNGDFNLIMGISIFSVVAIALAALVVDLIYPLIDPRVSYS